MSKVDLPAEELYNLFVESNLLPVSAVEYFDTNVIGTDKIVHCGCLIMPILLAEGKILQINSYNKRSAYAMIYEFVPGNKSPWLDFDAGMRFACGIKQDEKVVYGYANWHEAGQLVARRYKIDFESCAAGQWVLWRNPQDYRIYRAWIEGVGKDLLIKTDRHERVTFASYEILCKLMTKSREASVTPERIIPFYPEKINERTTDAGTPTVV